MIRRAPIPTVDRLSRHNQWKRSRFSLRRPWDSLRRRSAAADGDLYTALPTETGSPLVGRPALAERNSAGAGLATAV